MKSLLKSILYNTPRSLQLLVAVMLFIFIGVPDGKAAVEYHWTALINHGDAWGVFQPDPDKNMVNPSDFRMLSDGNYNTYVSTNKDYTGEHYLYIMTSNTNFRAGSRLVVAIRRVNNTSSLPYPTYMRLDVSRDGTNWDEGFAYLHFPYQGPRTWSFSEQVKIEAYKEIKYYKLVLLETHNGENYMVMSGVQIYMVEGLDNVTPIVKDQFNFTGDYDYGLNSGLKFTPTQGIVADKNRIADWTTWGDVFDVNGDWKDSGNVAKKLVEKGKDSVSVIVPSYKLLDNVSDKNIIAGTRQPAHVTEHTIYAMPGDVVTLTPYYDFWESDYYNENFAHWYDYKTGKNNKYLDFLVDASRIIKTDDYGYFGGSDLAGDCVKISSAADFKAFADRVNNGEIHLNAVLLNDIDLASIGNDAAVGTSNHHYCGNFNGFGHAIKSLAIELDEENVGLFRYVGNGAVIQNFRLLSDCSIKGKNKVALVGLAPETIGQFIVSDFASSANITATNGSASGVLGEKSSSSFFSHFVNCSIGGAIEGNYATAVAGWINSWSSVFENCISVATLDANRNDKNYTMFRNIPQRVDNCFDINGGKYKKSSTADTDFKVMYLHDHFNATDKKYSDDVVKEDGIYYYMYNATYQKKVMDEMDVYWKQDNDTYGLSFPVSQHSGEACRDKRFYGAVATFHVPLDPKKSKWEQWNFPDLNDVAIQTDVNGLHEYLIAADFSQSFNREKNLKLADDGHTITEIIEPEIAFRHIFHIKSGKDLADKYFSGYETNKEFVLINRRHILARADVDFQLRFDYPMPLHTRDGAGFYYRDPGVSSENAPGSYKKVYNVKLKTYKKDGRTPVDNTEMFYVGNQREIDASHNRMETFFNPEPRTVGGASYSVTSASELSRCLRCTAGNATPGTYIVRIVGLDIEDREIMWDDDHSLVIQEFEIDFAPEKKALVEREDVMHLGRKDDFSESGNLYTTTDKYLKDTYVKASSTIDFDDYRYLEELDNADDYIHTETDDDGNIVGKYFKWPLPWTDCSYCFGYDERYEWNTYQIGNHANVFEWHGMQYPYPEKNKFDGVTSSGTGIYDRLFYRTEGEEQGYMFYNNAASDPGVMVRPRLGKMCPGSTVHISAWVIELSGGVETANLTFNFVARLDDGTRIPMHTCNTGYVTTGNAGHWMHVYFQFVPNFTLKAPYLKTDDGEDLMGRIDHFEVELDNNCLSSAGADYAIDDINIYISNPRLTAQQTNIPCGNKGAVNIKVSTPYEVLMENLGEEQPATLQDGKDITMYYTFVDKEKFLAKYSELTAQTGGEEGADPYEAAFNYAQVNSSSLEFNTWIGEGTKNKAYTEGDETVGVVMYDGDNNIIFNVKSGDGIVSLDTGREYYVALWCPVTDEEKAVTEPTYKEFDLLGECSKVGVFRVQGSDKIKVDGVVYGPEDAIVVCENQSPVVSVDLYGYDQNDKDKEPVVKVPDAYYDWFEGSYQEYIAAKYNGVSLQVAVETLRNIEDYRDVDDLKNVKAEGDLTDGMIECLRYFTDYGSKAAHHLTLNRSSFVFPPVKIENEDEDEAYCYVVAVPLKHDTDKYVVCSEPTEVRITVRQHSPLMNPGFRELNEEYEEVNIANVPVRVGLEQIRNASYSIANAENEGLNEFSVPLREVMAATDGVRSMKRKPDPDDRVIVLAATNDPAYQSVIDYTAIDGGTPVGLASSGGNGDFRKVGYLRSIKAGVDDLGNENCVNFVFFDDFIFHEGYFYTLRLSYMEDNNDVEDGTKLDTNEDCPGHMLLTLKVVPKYVEWTGADNLNWAGDDNWRRVSSGDLNVADASTRSGFVIDDGVNGNTHAYAPLDFTNVIISPVGNSGINNYPRLFSPGMWSGGKVRGYDWPVGVDDEVSGYATKYIRYDMAAADADEDAGYNGYKCRPWYTNTCDSIHFRPLAEIDCQQYLEYKRAWVEFETLPGGWYRLSSPLKSTIAGEMYAPVRNAREESELFSKVKFHENINDRFAPAVYQRSWNNASGALVYEYNDSGTVDSSRPVHVAATWSNVFNDVEEPYCPGHGFSIKSDVTRVSGNTGSVLMRLPKDDGSYTYYNYVYETESGDDGSLSVVAKSEAGNSVTISRDSIGRLNDVASDFEVTVNADAASTIFLVGNPFMAHLDMDKFFEVNEGVIARKYWTVVNNKESAVIENDGRFDGTAEGSSAYLAPMTGFFVEKSVAARSLTVRFTPAMICVPSNSTASTAELSRSSAGQSRGLTLTAFADGVEASRAVVRLNESASADYRSSEDIMLFRDPELRNPANVYTVASGRALTFNVLPDVDGTEVGFLADSRSSEVTLLFEGIDESEGLMLLDTYTGERTPVGEGMEYTVDPAVARKLYLTRSIAATVGGDIEVSVVGRTVTALSPARAMTMEIYTVSGQLAARAESTGGTVSSRLEVPGIYVVRVIDADSRTRTSKHLIR